MEILLAYMLIDDEIPNVLQLGIKLTHDILYAKWPNAMMKFLQLGIKLTRLLKY